MATKTAKKAEKSTKFAVIKTGGKQYMVSEGDIITIEKLPEELIKDKKVTFEEVLLSEDAGNTKIGTPTVSGAKVEAELIEEGLAKKIDVIKFKSKSRYFKKNGHRQPYMKVKITAIN